MLILFLLLMLISLEVMDKNNSSDIDRSNIKILIELEERFI